MKRGAVTALSTLAAFSGIATATVSNAWASGYTYYATSINLNGNVLSSPKHITSKDPFGGSNGQMTSFVPIWYLMQALKSIGIMYTWDGNTLNLQVPNTVKVNYPSSPKALSLGTSVMDIQVNGRTVTYAPKIVYHDAGTTIATTFVPVYYLEKAFGYIGVNTGWDGTQWSMTTSWTPSTFSKVNLVKEFVTALHIQTDPSGTNPYTDVSSTDWPYVHAVLDKGYFQADSTTQFGSADTATEQDIDHAYQLYAGIPDSHMTWNAGGNLTAWANAIQLNKGLSSTTLTPTDEQTVQYNLESLFNGYSRDANGTYHLWFKPFDAWWYSKVPNWNLSAAQVSNAFNNAFQEVDSTTFTTNGSAIVFKVVGIPSTSTKEISVDSRNAQYSLDGGKTWQLPSIQYDSIDPTNGGVSNPPDMVLVKGISGGWVTVGQIMNTRDIATLSDNIKLTTDGNVSAQCISGSPYVNQQLGFVQAP
jgi:hypothetical protein